VAASNKSEELYSKKLPPKKSNKNIILCSCMLSIDPLLFGMHLVLGFSYMSVENGLAKKLYNINPTKKQ